MKSKTKKLGLLALIGLLLIGVILLSGCIGEKGFKQDDYCTGTYTDSKYGFSIECPEGWVKYSQTPGKDGTPAILKLWPPEIANALLAHFQQLKISML